MLFNSMEFVVFVLFFIPLYFISKGKQRLWVVLISSYIFYGWWDFRFLLLIWALTCINYYCGSRIAALKSKKDKKLPLVISIVSSLSILGYFKYYNFFAENISSLLHLVGLSSGFNLVNIILPLGISFYVFQTLSYTIDIYNEKINPERSFLNFAVFVAFFPQLVAGPILRASIFLPQIASERIYKSSDVINGLYLIVWGFFLKVVIADSLANVVDIRFNNVESQNSLSMLIGVIFYSFQIYGDFAGYSLIAIGLARVLGYKFPANFNRPYFSTNFSDFWQRWHISLSSWLRDYLYIPLGGGRCSKALKSRNIMITMLLGGMWHGASWNFIIWGGLHGMYLIIQNYFTSNYEFKFKYIVNFVKILFTFSVVSLTWVFFRSNDLHDSMYIVKNIFNYNGYIFSGVTEKFHVVKGIFLICTLVTIEIISFKINPLKIANKSPLFLILSTASLLVLISLFGTFESNSFIYFQF
jgi:alginate O-acetyltransferase complex protein AlgI